MIRLYLQINLHSSTKTNDTKILIIYLIHNYYDLMIPHFYLATGEHIAMCCQFSFCFLLISLTFPSAIQKKKEKLKYLNITFNTYN